MDTFNLDIVLNMFAEWQTQVLANPKDIWNILPRDIQCTCLLTQSDIYTRSRCKFCSLLLRLLNYRPYTKDFTLCYGKAQGLRVQLVDQPIHKLYIFSDQKLTQRLQFYASQYEMSKPTEVYRGDQFTINILTNWYIERALKRLNIPWFTHLYLAGICGPRGYMLVSAPSYRTFNDVRDKLSIDGGLVEGIWLQMIVYAHQLSAMDFSSAWPSLDNYCFLHQPVAYTYEKLRVISPIQLGLCNLQDASISVDGRRYIADRVEMNLLLANVNFLPSMKWRDQHFQVTYDIVHIYPILRQISPVVQDIEFYASILGLMIYVEVARLVWNTPRLAWRWKQMWTPEDLILINQQLEDIHANKRVPSVWDLLMYKWLRWDVIKTQI